MLPLCIAMCLNVILPNFSLAFSSVTFYQLARILLTPVVALMNFVLYRATLPRKAVLTLIPVCFGVGLVSYYDSKPANNDDVKTTSVLGIIFAFTGVFASSLYTVWIGSYHRKLEMNSMQLLFNQAPWSAFVLLYVIPFVDRFPDVAHTSASRWVMILMVRPPLVLIWEPLVPRNLTRPKLTQVFSSLVRHFCVSYQHFPVLHHRADGRGVQHRRGPSEDLYDCCAGLDRLRPSHWRQVDHWCHHRHRWYHPVRPPLDPASLVLPPVFMWLTGLPHSYYIVMNRHNKARAAQAVK
jgi:hypothetical protein